MSIGIANGAKILNAGTWMGNLIGPDGEEWDEMAVVEWPSFEMFQRSCEAPEYLEAVIHRTAALKDARLICFAPTTMEF